MIGRYYALDRDNRWEAWSRPPMTPWCAGRGTARTVQRRAVSAGRTRRDKIRRIPARHGDRHLRRVRPRRAA
ncbi:MAG: hypothetical protein U5L46_15040 [Agrobacterium sp.]|nr:hypothetical protein [Agrobacterium sp.]